MSSENWDGWRDVDDHLGCKARMAVEMEDGWIHFLLSPPDEVNPRDNHIHIKYKNSVGSVPVLCGITEKGEKSHSRRMLIERINEVTGLDLRYK